MSSNVPRFRTLCGAAWVNRNLHLTFGIVLQDWVVAGAYASLYRGVRGGKAG